MPPPLIKAFTLFILMMSVSACQANPAIDTSLPTATSVPTSVPGPVPSPLERDFQLHIDEPVLSLGPSGSWDSGLMDPGGVVFHAGKFHMFYNALPYFPGEIAVGYAVSSDGMTWERVVTEPILTVDDVQWKAQIANIRVNSAVIQEDTWVLYFSASSRIGLLTGQVGRATGSSPIGPWKVDEEPVLSPGKPGEWDAEAIGHVDVLSTEDGYVMYYSAARGIGVATSPDGIHWTKHNDPDTAEPAFATSDPVLSEASAEDPNVLQTERGWVMVFLQLNKLGYATSPDGVNWTELPEKIISLSYQSLGYSSLVLHDGRALLYFEAGQATSTPMTTSTYLATWTEE
jgi:hypothetical protein